MHLLETNRTFDTSHTEDLELKDSLNNCDSYQELVRQLNQTKTDSYANDKFREGIDNFLTKIENNKKVLTGRNKPLAKANQKIFGKQLLIDIFIDCMEPVLKSWLQKNDISITILLRAKLWPLREGLTGASLMECAELLSTEISFVDDKYLCSDYLEHAKTRFTDEESSILITKVSEFVFY
jgi:hypothetical protein